MKALKTSLALLTAGLLLSCGTEPGNTILTGTWNHVGLDAENITAMDSKDEEILAAGKTRLYKKNSNSAGSEWVSLNLQISPDDSELGDVLYTESGLFAVVKFTKYEEAVPEDFTSLYRSMDRGETWQPVDLNISIEGREKPYSVNLIAQSGSTLYAHVIHVFKSEDGGKTWTNLTSAWTHLTSGYPFAISEFIYVSKDHPNQIWAGGVTPISSPSLVKSEDGGATWAVLDQSISEGAADGGICAALVHPKNPRQVVIASGGSVIRKSTDSGKSWRTVAVEGGWIANLTPSVRDSKRIYGTGRNEQGTLFFAVSSDFGDTWETVEFGDGPARIRVNDMLSVLQNGKEVLYFATNQGVYSYTFEE